MTQDDHVHVPPLAQVEKEEPAEELRSSRQRGERRTRE